MATVNVFRAPAAGGAPAQVWAFGVGTAAEAILAHSHVKPLPASGRVAMSIDLMGPVGASVSYLAGSTPPAGNYIVVDSMPAAIAEPHHLVSFWRELHNVTFQRRGRVELGLLMQLPDGVYILGKPTLGSVMYIRPHWEALYQKIKTRLENAHNKGILLVGTPGIGHETAMLL